MHAQIEAADKWRREDREFREKQAAEGELEHDEFRKEIDRLRTKLGEKERYRDLYENILSEVRLNRTPKHSTAKCAVFALAR